jgi:hypothetical protein
MLARATRPKLSLTVPSAAAPSLSVSIPSAGTTPSKTVAPCSPLTFLAPVAYSSVASSVSCAPAASPLASAGAFTPITTRNTLFNARSLATLQIPPPQQPQLGRSSSRVREGRKRVQFSEEQTVRCLSPMPQEYYGEYSTMSREERRWGRGRQ